jgi:hypothetical protein
VGVGVGNGARDLGLADKLQRRAPAPGRQHGLRASIAEFDLQDGGAWPEVDGAHDAHQRSEQPDERLVPGEQPIAYDAQDRLHDARRGERVGIDVFRNRPALFDRGREAADVQATPFERPRARGKRLDEQDPRQQRLAVEQLEQRRERRAHPVLPAVGPGKRARYQLLRARVPEIHHRDEAVLEPAEALVESRARHLCARTHLCHGRARESPRAAVSTIASTIRALCSSAVSRRARGTV